MAKYRTASNLGSANGASAIGNIAPLHAPLPWQSFKRILCQSNALQIIAGRITESDIQSIAPLYNQMPRALGQRPIALSELFSRKTPGIRRLKLRASLPSCLANHRSASKTDVISHRATANPA
jgi:hypothetical protein